MQLVWIKCSRIDYVCEQASTHLGVTKGKSGAYKCGTWAGHHGELFIGLYEP